MDLICEIQFFIWNPGIDVMIVIEQIVMECETIWLCSEEKTAFCSCKTKNNHTA